MALSKGILEYWSIVGKYHPNANYIVTVCIVPQYIFVYICVSEPP